MANIENYLHDDEVKKIISDLVQLGIPGKHFSDIIDDEGHQYVDIVMEGGGVLGIALVGYIHVLEQMGLRFLQLGGASAGSISALILAAAGPINEAKAWWLTEKLASKNLSELMDGDEKVKSLINRFLLSEDDKPVKKKSKFRLMVGGAILSFINRDVFKTLFNELGLNPGENFVEWITSILKEKGIHTLEDLEKIRQQLPKGFRHRLDNRLLDATVFERIAIVAADITTETKVVFPEMADLYWNEPGKVNPAYFVRASMSIPAFFFPFSVEGIPLAGDGIREKWVRKTGYKGDIPGKIVFSDGGIMSNFPIDLFHNFGSIPSAPTLGVKLGVDRSKPQNTDRLPAYAGAVFNSARHVHDYDFFKRNPDYKHLVECIETGNHNWLNFNMEEKDKIDLFVRGARAASQFLKGFNWGKYKELRAEIKSAHELSNEVTIEKGKVLVQEKDSFSLPESTKKG